MMELCRTGFIVFNRYMISVELKPSVMNSNAEKIVLFYPGGRRGGKKCLRRLPRVLRPRATWAQL